jgi:hypothetical protein
MRSIWLRWMDGWWSMQRGSAGQTMSRNKRFGQLVDEGISSVAKRQSKTVAAVEMEIAEQLGYSQHTIQHWKRGNAPAQADHLIFLVRYCAQYGRVDRGWAQSIMAQAKYPATAQLLDELFGDATATKARVFLCYQRGVDPDDAVALRVAQALSQRYEVFFDQPGARAAGQIERVQTQLTQADHVIVFVSDEAMRGELLLSQVEMACDLRRTRQGRPGLLPVRLPHHEELLPSLSRYLSDLLWTYWENERDTDRLLEELQSALNGGALPLDYDRLPARLRAPRPQQPAFFAPLPSAQPDALEMPEGTIASDSSFYIARDHDRVAMAAIAQQGVTITIKGPRQVGKSSLLIRVCATAARQGKSVAFLDFQLLRPVLQDADAFFRHFASLLGYQLRLEDRTADYWGIPLPNPFRCTEYVGRHLAASLDRPLLLAMDEVDSVFDTPFRTDFFGMLRSWHNNRAFDPVWKKVDLALVTSTEPYYFIDNLNQSPFNVGEVIDLQPFTLEQAAELNRRHQSPLSEADVARLAELVYGHPYLVRRALYLVASGRMAQADLFARVTEDQGPFGDHLRSLLTRLYNKPELVAGLRQVLETQSCANDLFFRLRGAGLVRREQNHVVPNSPVYEKFFREHLGE